jgi:hypothetical protein
MARTTPALAAFLLVFFASCVRDDPAKPEKNPTIDFKTDSGYVFLSDTFPLNDTLHVGVMIVRGDDPIHTFKVLSSYDGTPEVMTDSLRIPSGSFTFDKTIITRGVAGTEKWTFWVQEHDGDIIRRALTFTVQ